MSPSDQMSFSPDDQEEKNVVYGGEDSSVGMSREPLNYFSNPRRDWSGDYQAST
jgi:hypothetical protein